MQNARRLRLLGAVLFLSLGLSGVQAGPASAGHRTVSVVDALGAASPTTTFSTFGAGGLSLLDNQQLGPRFTLAHRTVITEIGAFINVYGSGPARVEIRRAVNGVPDVRKVLARYVLSDDGTPLDVSFESAAVHLKLGAGTYFALFSAPTGSNGYVMCCASSPFDYRADSVPTGYYNPLDGTSSADPAEYLATRILGHSAKSHGRPRW